MPYTEPVRSPDTVRYSAAVHSLTKDVWLSVAMQAHDNGTTESDWDQVFQEFIDLLADSGKFEFGSSLYAGSKGWSQGSNILPTSWVEPDPGDDE